MILGMYLRCMIGGQKMNEELIEFCNIYKKMKELKLGHHKLDAGLVEEKDE